MPSSGCPKIPLPKGWPACATRALLHAIAVARLALLNVVTDFEHSVLPRARYTAEVSRLREQLTQRDEELRILRSRLEGIPAPNRPHYPPPERLAILTLRAATGWTLAETARRFLVTAKTVQDWVRRLDEHGPDALVALPVPVTRFPDYVATIVHKLRATVPAIGTRRLADSLARAGLHLSRSTVGRLLTRPLSKAPAPQEASSSPDADDVTADGANSNTKTQRTRTVTARYVHHLWHIDVTLLPTAGGFCVPWVPFSLPQCWPFSFHLAVILDHFSRSIVAWKLFYKEPTALAICSLLDQARDAVGRAPKYIVSDQGAQFQHDYRIWCDDNEVVPRFGAIGQSGSIAVLERFFRAFKQEMLRRLLLVPRRFVAMQREVFAYAFWYNQHRPSQALGGRTPAEVRDGGVAASERTRWETRARVMLPRGRGARARRVQGTLELVVERVDGREHLPIVSLRQAA
ncbi:MAG: transposase [Polyangiaceae bacterium]|nr:transposase [Polyangiaceae bacterium]